MKLPALFQWLGWLMLFGLNCWILEGLLLRLGISRDSLYHYRGGREQLKARWGFPVAWMALFMTVAEGTVLRGFSLAGVGDFFAGPGGMVLCSMGLLVFFAVGMYYVRR